MTGERGRLAWLAVLGGFVTLLLCSGLLALTGVAMRADGVIEAPLWQVLVCGSPAAIVIAAAVGVIAARLGGEMSALYRETSILAALRRRVRMADEAAERQRHIAETASAGMFELLSGLVAAEEGARGQLAAELHDTVAQSLAAARAQLDPDDPAAVTRVAELIAEAEEQVRAVMARTRPPALRDGDLARAITALRDDLRRRYAVELDLSWPLVPYPLPLATAVTVYRFFQEALLNVVKHAEVDIARAALWVDDDTLVAEVSDQGPGFNPDQVHSEGGRHVGLGLLRERARLVGGTLHVDSVRGHGTTITLRLPRGAVPATGMPPMPRLAVVSERAG